MGTIIDLLNRSANLSNFSEHTTMYFFYGLYRHMSSRHRRTAPITRTSAATFAPRKIAVLARPRLAATPHEPLASR